MQAQDIAKNKLSESNSTCVIVNGDKIIQSAERGIRPLLQLLLNNPELLEGADIADKIVGKAAAMLMVYGKVGSVYASVISEPAICVFQNYSIPFSYDKKEKFIQNRDRTGMCPMEKLAMPCVTPAETFEQLKKTIPIK